MNLEDQIKHDINTNKIILFLKGTKTNVPTSNFFIKCSGTLYANVLFNEMGRQISEYITII